MRTCALLVVFGAVISAQEPSTPADRELHWRQDLEFLASGLKAPGIRIAGGIATRGQKDLALLYPHFDAEIESLSADIPNLSDPEALLRLMRLIASAHVAHNRVQIPVAMGFASRLPLTFHWFADGLAVTGATSEYSAALGARVLSFNDVKPEQFAADLAPYVSYENDSELHMDAADLMTARGMLQHFQMIGADGRVLLHLEKPGGEQVTLPARPTLGGPEKIGIAQGLHVPVPLYLSHPGSYYWHEYLADSGSLYIQYNVCEHDPKERFGDFARKVLADADAHAVKRVVIDLRNNGGGNAHVIGPLKEGLASRLKSVGPIYVLIGPATFSSAVDNAIELRGTLSAKLIGEPSGGMPGGYGEVSTITLPNSKLVVRYTTKGSRAKGSEPNTLTPDIAAPLELADFLAGRDPALDAAIRGL
jgi:hypothetical protein